MRLRIKDVDVVRGTVTVRAGKGDKDRVTVLPKSLREEVAKQIENARGLWQNDREAGLAGVYMPGVMICEIVAGASRSSPLSGRLAQYCQLSSKESENRTADEQDGRRWTEKKSNRYQCSSSASICVICG